MGLLTMAALLSVHTVYASPKVSWQKSVTEAAESNADLGAARSSLRSTEYAVGAARSGFYPTLSATAGYTIDSTVAPRSFSSSITATENLFAGFSDAARINRAQNTSSASAAVLEGVKAKVSFDLKSAFMGVLYSQKYINLTEDIIKRREANLKLVQLRFESGTENIGSVNLSKAYLAQSKYDFLQAKDSLDVYRSELARVLGREDYSDLEVEGEVPITVPSYEDNQKINFKNLVKDVPDYKRTYFEEQSAKASIDLSKSSFYPILNLSESAGRTGREYNSPTNAWAIGATLTFPLLSGGKDYYAVKSATEDYRASALTRKSTEENSVTKLKDFYTKYVEAVMKLEVDQAFLLAANSRERIAKAQYNNGLISFIDWDNIENDLIIRQKNFLVSLRERVNSEAAWEQVQGKGVIP
jgi:outer membrane protein